MSSVAACRGSGVIRSKLPNTLEGLLEGAHGYLTDAECELMQKAYRLADTAHEGQFRRSGEAYIQHPIGVAGILVDLKLDVQSIVTALLHDTVEDTHLGLDDIQKHFGPKVQELVDGVTKLSKIKFRHTHEQQGENIRKMILAMGKDVRVILVKLADRLHNMRTLKYIPYEKQIRKAQETLDIYAPLAERLGMSSLKIELEDLSFRYVHPDAYYQLQQQMHIKQKQRDEYIESVKSILAKEIEARTNFPCEVNGRSKHFYSIYKKMQARQVAYEQVYDLLAFRLSVDTVSQCYAVLGIVHSLWKPIPGRFKDFIAMPKDNNYQSLHTTVMGPEGERIEIQIRTHDMHRVAEFGIAAHWRYKQQSDTSNNVDISRYRWLIEMVQLHQQSSGADEFLENVKHDLMEKDIYVFTPQGDVKDFPMGATPVDFAYAVHTDLGHHIVAARVNGRMVSLNHKLENGDTVEVVTSQHQHPSNDWLEFAVSARARAKIRAHVRTERRRLATQMGRDMLKSALVKMSLSLDRLTKHSQFNTFLKSNGCNNIDDLYSRIGFGTLTLEKLEQFFTGKTKKTEVTFMQKAWRQAFGAKRPADSLVRVDGVDDVLVRYAKCCDPIPGDAIVGFVSRGRGISVHRADCFKTFSVDVGRKINVGWRAQSKQNLALRLVRVRVLAHDEPGLLQHLSEVFSAQGMNIQSAQISTTRDKKAVCVFNVGVQGTTQLALLTRKLKKIKGVLGVTRVRQN